MVYTTYHIMSLPTSMSSSWLDNATEETPLLSAPQRPSTSVKPIGKAAASPLTPITSTPPSTVPPLTLQHISDNSDDIPVASGVLSSSITPMKTSVEPLKDPPSDIINRLVLHVGVTTTDPSQFLCTVTDTHTPHGSITSSRVVSSKVNALGVCCKTSLASSNQSLNEAGGSSGRSSLEERLSKIWSTSTESNPDCEGENCEGLDRRCRKCGKVVTSKTEETKKTSTPNVIFRNNSQTDPFRRPGMQQQLERPGSSGDHPASGRLNLLHLDMEPKPKNPHNYSTLLSTCSRNIKKKGSRRQSVDVIYAREPSEPSIDKIKAKRRLSRQTDVSSIELMTLNESVELEDISGRGPSWPPTTHNYDQPSIATLQVQGENMQRSHCQLSPGGTRIQNLRASSTESCPRVPWNSLETNLSTSQETEEKYIINQVDSHPMSQTFNIRTRVSLEPDVDSDHEEGGTKQQEGHSEDELRNRDARRRRSSTRTPDPRTRDTCWQDWEPILRQEWSAEAVILVALLVYIACKLINFVESIQPRRPENRK